MADKVKIAGNLVSLEFENHTLPNFILQKGKEFVRFGDHNNYLDYLVELKNRNAIHGAILKGKTAYIFGKGLSYNAETTNTYEVAKVAKWLGNANRYENWDSVYQKMCGYFEDFNGFALQVIWSLGGTKAEYYCMEFAKLRRSPCGNKVFYCENWILQSGKPNLQPDKDPSYKEYDIYNPDIRCGTQILYFKLDVPTTAKYGKLYPLPEYSGCIADVESDIEITSFHYNNLKNGMTASSMLSLFNGMPKTDEAKEQIANMVKRTHTGSLNAGKIMINFVDPGGTEAKVTMLTSSELDKQFDQLGKRLQQNIFTGHRADPMLFGVQTDNGISNPTGDQILTVWDKFLRAYVEPRQSILLKEIKDLGETTGINLSNLEVKQTTPVGVTLPTDPNVLALFNNATKQAYFAKKYGIELIADESGSTAVASANPAPAQHAEINEHLKNMSRKQWANIQKLVNDVKKGKVARASANMVLKNSYALNDQDIQTLFAMPEAQFSKFGNTEDYVYSLFESKSIDECIEDTFVSEDFIYTEVDALKKELKLQKQKFDDATDTQMQNSVLDILKGAPNTTPEQIAKQLGTDADTINAIINALIIGGLVAGTIGALTITEAGIAKKVPTVETEVYTVYKYVTRPDVPEAENTRPFCKKMLALSRNGKVWTRDALDDLTNALGEDAWVYRGGFYTNPDTHETTPYCRHCWKSVVKSRTKKK